MPFPLCSSDNFFHDGCSFLWAPWMLVTSTAQCGPQVSVIHSLNFFYYANQFVNKCLMFSLPPNYKCAGFFLTKHIIGLIFKDAPENSLLFPKPREETKHSPVLFPFPVWQWHCAGKGIHATGICQALKWSALLIRYRRTDQSTEPQSKEVEVT